MSSGINVVGTLGGAVGTVIAANAVVEALRRGGVPLAVYDTVVDTHGRAGQARPPVPFVDRVEDLPYDRTLFLDVVPAVWQQLATHPEFFRRQRRAFAFYYELSAIPLEWRPLLASFDTLFAPSRFVSDAIAGSVGARAQGMPVAPLVDRALAQRAPGRPYRVMYSFDPLSAEDRKNPLAGVEAFRRAFAGRDDAELVLKIWRTYKLDYAQDAIASVQALHPGIRVVQHDVSYEENLDLASTADCYLSLHRGEGLGLALLESMALGTTVVSTDFGGPRDFVDATTGVAIPYRLVETATHHHLFTAEALGEQGYWAEADVDAAALALRRLAGDSALNAELQAAARRRYDARRAAFLSLDWLEPFFSRPKYRVGNRPLLGVGL